MKLKLIISLLMAAMILPVKGQSQFVIVKDGHFEKDGKPYYYVGTNWSRPYRWRLVCIMIPSWRVSTT